MGKTAGVDLGGTWLRFGLVEPDGRISRFEKCPAPENWNDFVEILSGFIAEDEIDGFGAAVSGPVSDHARVLKAPNLPWLEGRNVRQDLESALKKRVIVSNDMEAATEGEMARGVLKDFTWAVFDTISTGWGGNLILNGLRVDGEPGHANVTFHSPYQCGSGHVGCREALYSGSGMERRIAEKLRERHISHPHKSPNLWTTFHSAVDKGDDWALGLLDDWAEGVGRAWANVLNRIRPLQAIAYMGQTAESLLPHRRVQERLRETMQRICMYPEHRRPDFPILAGKEKHRALYGAVMIYDKTS